LADEGKNWNCSFGNHVEVPVIPCAQWGAQRILPAYSKKLRIFPRTKVTVVAGKPLDFSKWYGKENDQAALEEATAFVMEAITNYSKKFVARKHQLKFLIQRNLICHELEISKG
jgi:1-acyl-sn-glycerol-3-phosphate acyltransferase